MSVFFITFMICLGLFFFSGIHDNIENEKELEAERASLMHTRVSGYVRDHDQIRPLDNRKPERRSTPVLPVVRKNERPTEVYPTDDEASRS